VKYGQGYTGATHRTNVFVKGTILFLQWRNFSLDVTSTKSTVAVILHNKVSLRNVGMLELPFIPRNKVWIVYLSGSDIHLYIYQRSQVCIL